MVISIDSFVLYNDKIVQGVIQVQEIIMQHLCTTRFKPDECTKVGGTMNYYGDKNLSRTVIGHKFYTVYVKCAGLAFSVQYETL